MKKGGGLGIGERAERRNGGLVTRWRAHDFVVFHGCEYKKFRVCVQPLPNMQTKKQRRGKQGDNYKNKKQKENVAKGPPALTVTATMNPALSGTVHRFIDLVCWLLMSSV